MKETKLQVNVRATGRKFYVRKVDGSNDWHINFVPPKEARLRGAPSRVFRSCGTNLLSIAKLRAAEIIESFFTADAGARAESLKMRTAYPKLGTLLDRFEPDPGDMKADTKWKVKSALRLIVREVTGAADPAELCCDILTKELADKFLDGRVAKARHAAGANEVTTQRARVTANSTLKQARGIVTPRACEKFYADLKLPDFSGFRSAELKRVRSGFYEYRRIPASVMDAIDRDAERIKHEDPLVYRAFVLERYLGLRPSEVVNARWSWIDRRDGQDVFVIELRPDFVPKNGKARNIPIEPGVKAMLAEMQATAHPEAYIIELPFLTDRKNVLKYDVNKWLRHFLPASSREKCSYNLRKQAGSEINDRYGIAVAAAYLGDTIAVAQKHYTARATIPGGLAPAIRLAA